MDFMDPKRRRRYTAMLFTGYGLVGLAIVLLSLILLFVAYGFGYKNGQVIQNGLLFLSSTPNPAQIYIDGKRYSSDTNARLVLPAGDYNFVLKRSGYRDWQRMISVNGGEVQTYAYPFFFPSSLTTNTKHDYSGAPALVTESPDRRWLLVSLPGSLTAFDVYDLNNPTKAPTAMTIPENLLSAAPGTQQLEVGDWADDNIHLLVKHTYGTSTEYLLLNRSSPTQSVNLSKALALPAGTELTLSNKKYDQYFVFDSTKQTLSRAGLSKPLQPYLTGVLAYRTYGDRTVLYVTPDALDKTKVDVNYYDGSATYMIRKDSAGSTYLLDLTTYSGDMYVAVSTASENVAYIYKNPISQLTSKQLGVAVPVQVFSLKNPSYVAFSANAQYIAFESGASFAVYDAENELGYTYTASDTLDKPQTHALWMDGAHLAYVSRGQVVVADYDGQNRQVLVSAGPRYNFYFDRSYKFLYTMVPAAADKNHELLTSTSLRTPSDQ